VDNSLFVSYDGDSVGREIGMARLRNEPDEVRRISQAIEKGNEIFKAWALASGGNTVESGGDEGLLQIPAVALNGLEQVRANYESATSATVSVGIGKEISQSSKALMVAKLRGKNRSCFYDETVEKEYQKEVSETKNDEQKLRAEYLAKTLPIANQNIQLEGSASKGQRSHGVSAPHKQLRDTNENKQIAALTGFAEPKEDDVGFTHGKNPVQVEDSGSGATQGFLEQFGQQADQNEQTDKVKSLRRSDSLKQLKQQVAGALESLRQQLPVISQLKQAYPDTYKSILGLVQSVIGLGQGLQEIDQTLQKSESQRKRPWVGGGITIPANGTPERKNWETNFKNSLAGYFANGDSESLKPITVKISDLQQSHNVNTENNDRYRLYTRMALGDKLPPIMVGKNLAGKLVVLDGHHRIAAAQKAGHTEIPAYERIQPIHKDMLQTSEPVNTYDLGLFKNGLSENVRPEELDPDQLAIGTQREMSEHGVDFETARGIAADHLVEDPEAYSKDDEKETWNDGIDMDTRKEELDPNKALPDSKVLDKDGLEKVGLEGSLPVGTLKDGRLKVKHYDGSVGWVGVKEGMVRSQDPSGHPVSSIRPGAR
jgi:minimal CRISPR polymerase domain/ParB-like nuclease domain